MATAVQYLKEFQKGYQPPFQTQPNAPGMQHRLDPLPIDDTYADGRPYKGSQKLAGRTALITGADSGIGRAVAILFALEGANLTLSYTQKEESEAKAVMEAVKAKAPAALVHLVAADLRTENHCTALIEEHMKKFGKLDALCVRFIYPIRTYILTQSLRILNHGTQQANTDITTLSSEQWHNVFDTNIHSFFYLSKAAIPHMTPGSSVVFNASINMAVGHPELLDYTATKGAMVAYMRALSNQIVGEKGIRVNCTLLSLFY
jgi:NAD(P)-dependent dehydrogenase (short-subunit alcohol dehydrogenase family)